MDKTNLSKKAGLLMAGCLITLNAFGQATIKGQVVDATGEPVIGASILVKDTKNGAVSDLDGGYTLNNVKGWCRPGILLLRVIVPRRFL